LAFRLQFALKWTLAEFRLFNAAMGHVPFPFQQSIRIKYSPGTT
jgi:hypothetical protein